jgi:hypothetical protein
MYLQKEISKKTLKKLSMLSAINEKYVLNKYRTRYTVPTLDG